MKHSQMIEDAGKNSQHNQHVLSEGSVHGCYHCITTFTYDEITDWTDNGTTALCPRCGVDSVLPEVTNTALLAEMCEYWFTGKDAYKEPDDEPEVLTILQKLKVLETVKQIYNIHYCNAGVGIVFFNSDKVVDKVNWKNGLTVDKYYPTFEDCINAEYRIAVDEQMVEAEPIRTEHHADRKYIDGQTDQRYTVYEYMFVTGTENTIVLTKTINELVGEGWEVDGDISVAIWVSTIKFVQRMRREKAEG